jgi:hypothetical protein
MVRIHSLVVPFALALSLLGCPLSIHEETSGLLPEESGIQDAGGEVPDAGPDSDGGIDAGTEDGGFTFAEACGQLVPAYCAYAARCEQAVSAEACERWYLAPGTSPLHCTPDAWESLAKGRVSFNPTRTRTCLDKLRNLSCELDPFRIAECPNLILVEGKVYDGKECFSHGDCKPTSYCKGSGCPGTCTPRLRLGADAGIDDLCASGLYRYEGKCVPPAGPGKTCAPIAKANTRQECPYGYYCDDGEICRLRPKQGEKCDGQVCRVGLQCAAGTCQPPSAAGEPCDVQGPVTCQLGLSCVPTPGTPVGVCVALAAEGGACGPSMPGCDPLLYCDGGLCDQRKGAGETCGSEAECGLDLYCTTPGGSGRCVETKPEGTACLVSEECVAGLGCGPERMCRPFTCYDPTP